MFERPRKKLSAGRPAALRPPPPAMADVRDVLGMSRGTAAASSSSHQPPSALSAHRASAPHPPAHHHHAHARDSHGISGRELAQLKSESFWAANAAPIAPTLNNLVGGMKQKRSKSEDDLDLGHWVKIHSVPDYRFAKFDKRIKLLEYTHEEYERYLQEPEGGWTRAETDRLMTLAKQYDLRFIIMEDRYNAPIREAHKQRGMEQLPKVDSKAIHALLHKPETDKARMEQEAKDLIVLAPNVTASTHPSPALSAEAAATIAASSTSAAAAATDGAVAMDTSADSVSAASASAAAASSSSAAAASSSSDSLVVSLAGPGSLIVPPLAPVPSAPAPSPALTLPRLGAAGPVLAERTVEQLKARFYMVQQTLTAVRNSSDPDLKKSNPLFTHPYDATHEALRKEQLARLFARTQAETDHMAQVVIEHRKLSAAVQKIKKGQKEERDALRGVSKKGGAGAAGLAAGGVSGGRLASGASALGAPGSTKKGASSLALGGSSLKGSRSSSGMLQQSQPLVGELAPIPPVVEQTVASVLPSRAPGVYLRSTQLSAPLNMTARQSKFLDAELASLPGHLKRVREGTVPTSSVCDLYDKLRVNLLTLQALQIYMRDRETVRDDLRIHVTNKNIMQQQQQHLQQQAPAAAAAASAPASGGGGGDAAAAAAAAQRKKAEKRKVDADGEQDDKRQRKTK